MMIYVGKEMLSVQEVLAAHPEMSIHSHKLYMASCDLNVSKKCRKIYKIQFREAFAIANRNNGKLICIFCSRATKSTGRNNPNTKYHFNDNYFESIDSDTKAYILGWIGSDGSIATRGFNISIHEKDIKTIEIIRNNICKKIPIRLIRMKPNKLVKYKNGISNMCKLTVNSIKMSQDLCKIFRIRPGKKSNTINFPNINPKYFRAFIRGYFEGDGSINNMLSSKCKSPRCSIKSNSHNMLTGIAKAIKIPCNIYNNVLVFNNKTSLEFLNYIYSNHKNLVLDRKYNIYIYWKNNYIYNNIANRRRGRSHPHYNKSFSLETRKKLSLAHSGDKSYCAKLTWAKVNKIREKYSTGKYSCNSLSKFYKVARTTINSIVNNLTWKDDKYIYKNKLNETT